MKDTIMLHNSYYFEVQCDIKNICKLHRTDFSDQNTLTYLRACFINLVYYSAVACVVHVRSFMLTSLAHCLITKKEKKRNNWKHATWCINPYCHVTEFMVNVHVQCTSYMFQCLWFYVGLQKDFFSCDQTGSWLRRLNRLYRV